MIGLICFSKTGKHYRTLDEIFIDRHKNITYGEYKKNKDTLPKEVLIEEAYQKLKKTLGSQKSLDDFFEWYKNHRNVKVSKCKTNTKTIYTIGDINKNIRNEEIEMAEKNKLNIGSKKDEAEAPEQPERTIEDTEGTWLSKSKKGTAIFVTIPVDDLNKMEVSKYTNKDGDEIEQVQLVTSVESLERVLSGEIKGTKLGYFKSK